MRNRKECGKEKRYKNILSVVLWDHLIPDTYYIAQRIFQKQHRWMPLKHTGWSSCSYQNLGTFTYHILLYHPGFLHPCWRFQGREGKQCHIFPCTHTYTPGNRLMLELLFCEMESSRRSPTGLLSAPSAAAWRRETFAFTSCIFCSDVSPAKKKT